MPTAYPRPAGIVLDDAPRRKPYHCAMVHATFSLAGFRATRGERSGEPKATSGS
jgi:hypothetical protein